MKSEDKIKKALNVLTGMCDREKSLVNKFIVNDMAKSLSSSFQDIQNTLDAQSNHVEELQEQIESQQATIDELTEHLESLMGGYENNEPLSSIELDEIKDLINSVKEVSE